MIAWVVCSVLSCFILFHQKTTPNNRIKRWSDDACAKDNASHSTWLFNLQLVQVCKYKSCFFWNSWCQHQLCSRSGIRIWSNILTLHHFWFLYFSGVFWVGDAWRTGHKFTKKNSSASVTAGAESKVSSTSPNSTRWPLSFTCRHSCHGRTAAADLTLKWNWNDLESEISEMIHDMIHDMIKIHLKWSQDIWSFKMVMLQKHAYKHHTLFKSRTNHDQISISTSWFITHLIVQSTHKFQEIVLFCKTSWNMTD